MAKSNHWGQRKINLETQSKSERRKQVKEIDKQEDRFTKLVEKLRQNASNGKDKAGAK
jgi:hypothetical protein